jgi:hypothetical protein
MLPAATDVAGDDHFQILEFPIRKPVEKGLYPATDILFTRVAFAEVVRPTDAATRTTCGRSPGLAMRAPLAPTTISRRSQPDEQAGQATGYYLKNLRRLDAVPH